MSVAAPVLERKVSSETEEKDYFDAALTEDEIHNSRISEIYAKLLDPEATIKDFHIEEAAEPAKKELFAEIDSASVKPYLVENARADADIFRADSSINRIAAPVAPAAPVIDEAVSEDEENEDLRPTVTTIQYKTTSQSKTIEEAKIETQSVEKREGLTKKQRIVIAVIVSLVVALLAIIIINSAIISNLNNDLSSLQSTLSNAKTIVNNINNQVDELRSSLDERVFEFIDQNGMVPRI